MSIRQWSIRHGVLMETLYAGVKYCLITLHPLWQKIGYQRLEKPVAFLEKGVKGMLFNCQMCGACILSDTGMSCPMNCPKNLRNGPCGGVRLNGNCEVKPEMPCVWVEAWQGSQQLKQDKTIHHVQPAVDYRWQGTSAWLRMTQEAVGASEEHP